MTEEQGWELIQKYPGQLLADPFSNAESDREAWVIFDHAILGDIDNFKKILEKVWRKPNA